MNSEKENIILVMYLDVRNVPPDQIYQYTNTTMKNLTEKEDKHFNIQWFLIPVRSKTKLKCIYPIKRKLRFKTLYNLIKIKVVCILEKIKSE